MRVSWIIAALSFGLAANSMNILDADVSNLDILQIPQSLAALSHGNTGELSLTRRITSVRPGDMMQISFNIPMEKERTPEFSELLAAVYSTKDGSLVKVLSKAPAKQIDGLKDAEFKGGRDIRLYLPVSGLTSEKEFVMYKLALIAPERDQSGRWKRYSADTMLFAYDGAN
ncbi:hypothetical protein IW146_001383 [Coemansia sp. RSA 922]|nr:hypothetical protein LPJ71_007219 [Coemansia sp. S17]KAJ2021336.1 hypothetical protein GGI14_000117 [Coemansia sp. S680]KAJ2051500.1 hypothetical protein GGI08_005254 [Coemansia sp. S2]KAJ2068236.1 hypothetical protein GGH13_004991 [Coemansia sp. S155-1]KAJ2085207.1 hypothetical protein GGI09_006950 [Coemansia sp. S100]KAJ2116631.1 hypothetical protein IW146_001383 [Coemansia sp. RSA 922]KAJ2332384.1 hypothetical protein GGH92_008939 [Coemansia sp. RSA 2673]